jgi:hypothetical protein
MRWSGPLGHALAETLPLSKRSTVPLSIATALFVPFVTFNNSSRGIVDDNHQAQ